MTNRFSVIFIALFSPFLLFAQLNDTFSDGDFSQNPAWQGEDSRFLVNGQQELQSDGMNGSDRIYLSTPNQLLDGVEWRLKTRFLQNPSNGNFLKVYLAADSADLEGPLNGYYLRLGESGSDDGIDFYRQDSLTETILIDGPAGTLTNGWDLELKVTRDSLGNWEILADFTGAGLFQSQGQFFDDTHQSTAFFGFAIAHTSSRRDEFFFDDCYIGAPIVDTLAPELDSLQIVSGTELLLFFSEVVAKNEAEDPSNFLINQGVGNPATALRETVDSSQVRLQLANPLVSGQTHLLTVQGQSDLSGNVMSQADSATFYFFVPDTAQGGEVIINEVLADPTPQQGLPEAEFVELFNRSSQTFELENWILDNGTVQAQLPPFLLEPGAYLIVAPADDAQEFAAFGPVISPSSWPALVNGGDNLGLRSAAGRLIDSLDYDADWYQDDDKDDGGYSLERINPQEIACPVRSNWGAAVDPAGGTPGQQNSIFSLSPDSSPPGLLSIELLASDTLLLLFTESMDPQSLSDPLNYILSPGLGSPVFVQPLGPDFQAVRLAWADSLTAGESYQLRVEEVADCSGNVVPDALQGAVLLGREALPFEVVINELMADEAPSRGLPEVEFAEIYNRSSQAITLDGWRLSDIGGTGEVGRAVIPGEGYALLCRASDSLALSPFGQVIPLSSWPGLNNSGELIQLLNANGEIMDYVSYSDSWYGDEEKAEGGYSLERRDASFFDCNQPANWGASLAASGGTPGAVNSLDGPFVDEEAPSLLKVRVVDELSLELLFSEPMDPGSLEEVQHYLIEPDLGQPDLAFPDAPFYEKVTLLLSSSLDSQQVYRLAFSGLTDCAGNELAGTVFLGLPRRPEAGEVLLNEILFNPFSGGRDFVEIYNSSEKIVDLQNLRLGEIFPGTDSIFNDKPVAAEEALLLPGQLLCLTTDAQLQRDTYLPPDTARFWEMGSFPSYDDREGECVLFVENGPVLDRFFYLDDYHFPTLTQDDGVSLERISLDQPTQSPDNWHSASSLVGFATPGYPNSQAQELDPGSEEVSLERSTFSPDGDGFEDVLPIHYDFDFQGGNARVLVLDQQGRLIRTLQQNQLLGTPSGTFFWDGRNEDNRKAPVGPYVILFEVVRPDTGQKRVYRRVGVLAKRL